MLPETILCLKAVWQLPYRATDRSCFAIRRTTADGGVAIGLVRKLITYSAKLRERQFRVGRRAVGGLPSARRPLADLETSIFLSHRQFPNRRSAKTARNPMRFSLKIALGPTSSPFSEVFHTVKWRFLADFPTNRIFSKQLFS